MHKTTTNQNGNPVLKASSGCISVVPLKSEDPGWAEFTQFTRESFKTYLRKYLDAIHQYKPGFQITSNWSYTGYMPEPVDANIDFISGDVASNSSVYSAGRPHRAILLMGWGMSDNKFWMHLTINLLHL